MQPKRSVLFSAAPPENNAWTKSDRAILLRKLFYRGLISNSFISNSLISNSWHDDDDDDDDGDDDGDGDDDDDDDDGDDDDDDERKNLKKTKFVSNDRSGHDDQFCPKSSKSELSSRFFGRLKILKISNETNENLMKI